jgi:CubicO group peptidase (beta-lactamase class C family)
MVDARVDKALQYALQLGEQGVQIAAYVGDEVVVDTWTGMADVSTGRLVDAETMFTVFSVSKAITVTALHILAERGLIDYDALISDYWPEFGCNGKEATTVRHALTHRAGIPQMPVGVTPQLMCDWDWMVEHIAQLTPLYAPGTTSAYHSLVFGWLVGEIVHRADPAGRDFGTIVREEICVPLGIEDLWLGVPDSALPRVAFLTSDMEDVVDLASPSARTIPPAVAPMARVHNRPEVIQGCIPGAGVVMSARAGARFFAMLANGGELDGVRLLSEQRVSALTEPRENSGELDRNLGAGGTIAPRISVGGYWLSDPTAGNGPNMLCHGGSGGSIGWADLDWRLGATICHNRMFDTVGPDGMLPHPFAPLGDALREIADERLAQI